MARRTKLMQIAEKYGDKGAGALNPRTIDGVVYQLCELAEIAFGPDFIGQLEEDITLTECSYSRKRALCYLTDQFLRKNLAPIMLESNIDAMGGRIKNLPALCEESYVDYFVTFSTFEHSTFRSPIQKACVDIPGILVGYQTETSYPVCQGVITFFRERKDQLGLFLLIQGLCEKIKRESKFVPAEE
jgi:hypothetical protein